MQHAKQSRFLQLHPRFLGLWVFVFAIYICNSGLSSAVSSKKDKVLSVEGYLKQNSNPDIQCIYVIAGRIFAFITYKCRDILF